MIIALIASLLTGLVAARARYATDGGLSQKPAGDEVAPGPPVNLMHFGFLAQRSFEEGDPPTGRIKFDLFPRLSVPIDNPLLLVDPKARVHLTRLTDERGSDLPRTLSLSGPELEPHFETSRLAVSYGSVSLDRFVYRIPAMEGTLEYAVVTEDVTRDILLEREPVIVNPAPGVEVRLERSRGEPRTGVASYTIDDKVAAAALGAGACPIINLAGGPGTAQGEARRSAGPPRRITTRFGAPGVPTPICIHAVLRTEAVRSSFRFEDLRLLDEPAPEPTGAPVVVTATTDGDCRASLHHLSISGTAGRSAPPSDLGLTLIFKLNALPSGRPLKTRGFVITDITDEAGRPLSFTAPQAGPDPAGSVTPAEPSALVGVPIPHYNPAAVMVTFSVATMPGRLGRIRGHAIVSETTAEANERPVSFEFSSVPVTAH